MPCDSIIPLNNTPDEKERSFFRGLFGRQLGVVFQGCASLISTNCMVFFYHNALNASVFKQIGQAPS